MSTTKSHTFANGYQITIADDGHSYSLTAPGLRLSECRIAAASDQVPHGLAGKLKWQELRPNRARLSAASPLGELTLDIHTVKLGRDAALTLALTLKPQASHRWVMLAPLAGVTMRRVKHLLTHGRSMGGCRLRLLPSAAAAEEPELRSHFQCVITCAKAKLHLSHPLRQDHISAVKGVVKGTTISDLAAGTRFEFTGKRNLKAELLTIAAVEDGHSAMCAWGDAQVTTPLPATPDPIGWNSWDSYRWTITEDEVLANAEFIAADPVLSKHVKRIIVDDGWQYCYGEWEANHNFPGGMQALATRLHKLGFEAGLWICPTAAEPHSRIAQWHTEMLAQSEGGDPCLAFDCMRRLGFIIDPTRDDTKQWLYNLFDRYAGMGYTYFKLDFLAQTLKAPRFHRNVPRGRMMREIITPIHAALKDRASILGCGYIYDGGDDMVKMVRAGSDVHATWMETRQNATSLAARFWASNRLWITDPDFALCRGPDTSNDPELGRLRCVYVFVTPQEQRREFVPGRYWSEGFDTIRAHEAEVLLSLAIINGGAINLADKLYRLNELGLDMVRRTVAAARGSAPVPLDLFESELPTRWWHTIPGGFRTLLINWGDTPQEVVLDLEPLGLQATSGRNFWNDKSVKISGNRIVASLAPHCCQFLEITAKV